MEVFMVPRVEICFASHKRILMQPYYGGMYEHSFKIYSGRNEYSVYLNGIQLKTNAVFSDKETILHVRYFPNGTKTDFKINDDNKGIFDSINDSHLFIHSATWAGELETFSHEYLENRIANWNPCEYFAQLEYMGGGVFCKKFEFKKVLLEPFVLRYKIAFNNSWEKSLGMSDGSNISVQLPAGTKDFSVYVDTVRKISKNSVITPNFYLHLPDNKLMDMKSFSPDIKLFGTINRKPVLEKRVFHQISHDLYALYEWFPAGKHSYTCSFSDFLISGKISTSEFELKKDKDIIFVYDLADGGRLVDSVNSPEEVIALLGLRSSLDYKELDKYAYMGEDLGATYSKDFTVFKLWAPTAQKVKLKLYSNGSDTETGAKELGVMNMRTNKDTVWEIKINSDLKNTYYTYLVTIDSVTFETVDIYAKATGANGNRAMVVDLADTNPGNWENDKPVRCKNQTDAIIWEVGIKDFSYLANSGISEENRGKFLAFTEKNTSVDKQGEHKTCLAYLKELGITHVHLMPCFDFASIDESSKDKELYNWGYDPKSYNVPEGYFSSDSLNGAVRIKEFKQMVQSLHEEGIGVIMDVVYNHTFQNEDSAFNLTVPGYYYRHYKGKLANASGCGNETASERAMFRKYMIDSVKYWVKEYHIDGFRFDLMGIHDTETINQIRSELDLLDNGKGILMYGEPWSALPTSQDEGIDMCTKNNIHLLDDRIAVFNDEMRNSVAGKIQNRVESVGYVEGDFNNTQSLKSAILGQNINLGDDRYLYFAKCPSQVVNFVSCHDNFTLYDKLVLATKSGIGYEQKYDDIIAMNKLAAAIVITSQGIPFWQAGEEFARTKYGNSNSYNAPAHLNALDWSRLREYSELVEYYKGLIKIRKKYSVLRNADTLSAINIKFSNTYDDSLIAYTITKNSDNPGPILAIAFNSSNSEKNITFEIADDLAKVKKWAVLANANTAGTEELYEIQGNSCAISARSALILALKQH